MWIHITQEPQKSYVVHLFNRYNFSGDSLVFIVASITAFYAIRSFRASKRQNELSTVPHLTLERQGSVGDYALLLKNHNARFAYKIKIDKIKTLDHRTNKYGTTSMEVEPHHKNGRIDFMEDQTEPLSLKISFDGKHKVDQDFAIFLTTLLTQYPHGFIIRFRDSQNASYFTRLTFDPNNKGRPRILRAPTRLSIAWRFSLWAERNLYDRLYLRYMWLRETKLIKNIRSKI